MSILRAKYKIPEKVELQHYKLGKWLVNKPPELVVIPMIALIEGGMEVPMGKVIWDFLINFRLSSIQCFPNLFRVLGSTDMLNRKMGTYLTCHDMNWVYNCQKGKETSHYSRV